MIVTYSARVNRARMNKAVESGQRIALSLAESHKWNPWVNVKVD